MRDDSLQGATPSPSFSRGAMADLDHDWSMQFSQHERDHHERQHRLVGRYLLFVAPLVGPLPSRHATMTTMRRSTTQNGFGHVFAPVLFPFPRSPKTSPSSLSSRPGRTYTRSLTLAIHGSNPHTLLLQWLVSSSFLCSPLLRSPTLAQGSRPASRIYAPSSAMTSVSRPTMLPTGLAMPPA